MPFGVYLAEHSGQVHVDSHLVVVTKIAYQRVQVVKSNKAANCCSAVLSVNCRLQQSGTRI